MSTVSAAASRSVSGIGTWGADDGSRPSAAGEPSSSPSPCRGEDAGEDGDGPPPRPASPMPPPALLSPPSLPPPQCRHRAFLYRPGCTPPPTNVAINVQPTPLPEAHDPPELDAARFTEELRYYMQKHSPAHLGTRRPKGTLAAPVVDRYSDKYALDAKAAAAAPGVASKISAIVTGKAWCRWGGATHLLDRSRLFPRRAPLGLSERVVGSADSRRRSSGDRRAARLLPRHTGPDQGAGGQGRRLSPRRTLQPGRSGGQGRGRGGWRGG